jgi:hypothetical protein
MTRRIRVFPTGPLQHTDIGSQRPLLFCARPIHCLTPSAPIGLRQQIVIPGRSSANALTKAGGASRQFPRRQRREGIDHWLRLGGVRCHSSYAAIQRLIGVCKRSIPGADRHRPTRATAGKPATRRMSAIAREASDGGQTRIRPELRLASQPPSSRARQAPCKSDSACRFRNALSMSSGAMRSRIATTLDSHLTWQPTRNTQLRRLRPYGVRPTVASCCHDRIRRRIQSHQG